MKLSLFSLVDHYPEQGIPVGDRLRSAVRRAELAEFLGYDGLWFAEHHLRDFGALPNPAVLLAAIAARTSRIRLGPAVAVLPLRHPLQVAEDYLLVDQLSGGRLDLGVGSGTLDFEFAGFGVDLDRKAERFAEALEVLRPVLRGERGAVDGRHYRVDHQRSNVPPVRPPGPPLYVATNRPEHARMAGKNGDGLLTLLSPDIAGLEVLDERLEGYRCGQAERPDAGGEAVVTVLAHAAGSVAEGRDQARAAMRRFLAAHGELGESQADAVFDAMIDRGTGWFGGAETLESGLRALKARGVGQVTLWLGFGGMVEDEVETAMTVVAREVRPRIGAAEAAGAKTAGPEPSSA